MNMGVSIYRATSSTRRECVMSVLLLAVVLMVGVLICILLIAFEWARSKKVDKENIIGHSTQQGWVSKSKDSAVVDQRRRVY